MTDPFEDSAARTESALELPLDFSRGPATEMVRESHPFELALPRLSPIAGAPAGRDAYPPEVIAAALFGIALHRYSGQSSIPLLLSRWTSAGRAPRAAPPPLDTPPGTTCRELLAQIAERLGARAPHAGSDERAPGRSTPGASSTRDDASSTRAVRPQGAAFTWVDRELALGEPDPLRLTDRAPLEGREFDLHLLVSGDAGAIRAPDGKPGERADRHRAVIVYNASLFKRASIERIAGHLGELSAHLADSLDAPLSRAPLLPSAERGWLERISRGPSRPLAEEPIHRLFERWAETAPDAIAVRYADRVLTYRELNTMANRMAWHLTAAGVDAESRVVVCVEPSFDIAIALLGILKAGGVYVPLDPTYPAARIRAILEDTRPALVLSRSHLIERLELGRESSTLALDTHEWPSDPGAGANPSVPIDLNQTASIYYTSGTTGKPKGVMASHANLTSYVQMARDRYGFCARDVIPAIARFSFSISMFELMMPLASGGTLVVLDREHVLDPERMLRTLGEVTFFHAGPSLLKHLIAHIERGAPALAPFSRVRHASSGGDMVPPEALESLKKHFPAAEVFVIYGCSEISCMGCTYAVPRDRTVTKTYVGRPFDNVTVKVLDGELGQVPAGVVGEVWFAGPGVVKGYWNRPELTADKFVELDGQRFYRTGDLGRLHDDGLLELVGRNDFQIKLRGMRIELAELEHTLRRAPGVRDGVVAARPGANGEKYLTAYVVLEADDGAAGAGARPSRIAAVRRHMADHLPDYMVPASYVELAALPLNHNMKLDRFALPDPERLDGAAAACAPSRDPETPTERLFASVWRKLLGVQEVGLDDNFFELGGDSILATAFILDIQRDLGVELEGIEVLRESLEVLASVADERRGATARKSAAPRAAAPAANDAIETFHFGTDRSLYGVLHVPTAAAAEETALICAPVGQERVRAHFVLARLARQLAAQGIATLRFDYYGCADSMGESIDATFARWQRDVADAFAELASRTGAKQVIAIGARLGATILCNVLDRLDVSRLVLWDPVCKGAEYYAEQAAMHRDYVRGMLGLRLGRRPKRLKGAEELLGFTYSEAALRELRELTIPPIAAAGRLPVRWLATSRPAHQRASFHSIIGPAEGCRIDALDFDCRWNEVARLEDIVPDVGIARALSAMARDKAANTARDRRGAAIKDTIRPIEEKA